MENTPKTNETPNEHVNSPFYERPTGVNRNLTEVAPQPLETEDDFLTRADKQLEEQYPDASEDDRNKMIGAILASERQQMDPNYGKKQQEHEAQTDEAYRKEIRELQEEYEKHRANIRELRDLGITSEETFQISNVNNMRKWLDDRREAFERYETEFHKRVEAGELSAEEVEEFRKREMDELNQQHEQIVNYEAGRLGIDIGLDSGLVSRFVEGDFSKEVSRADLEEIIKYGLATEGGRTDAKDIEQFIDGLWQPELETIQRNAIMRIVADPIRSRNVIERSGASHDESYFVLPIQNPEFTEYVAENLKDKNGDLIICAGLSEVLGYGTKDEAIERAKWFYNLAHETAGLNTEAILDRVEALNIARGNSGNQKWQERYNEFVANIIDWGETKPVAGQDIKDERGIEEIKISTDDLRIQLEEKLNELKEALDFQGSLGSPSKKHNGNRSDGKGDSGVDAIDRIVSEIVRLNRSIQHIEGTQHIIDHVRSDIDFQELGVKIEEPIYYEGAWIKNRCTVSVFKIESPASIGEAWAFISEGTEVSEQNIYYGIMDSLDAIKRLFSGIYYRQSGFKPNIKDVGGVKYVSHHSARPDRFKPIVERGWWSEDDLNNLRRESAYEEITDFFIGIINDESIESSIIKKSDLARAEALETVEVAEPNEGLDSPQEEDGALLEQTMEEVAPIERPTELDDVRTEEEAKQSTGETNSPKKKSDKEILNEIKSAVSNAGRKKIDIQNRFARELARTPKNVMLEAYSESDIRRIGQILDKYGYEHPKWLDE